jgi:hypothetical protein
MWAIIVARLMTSPLILGPLPWSAPAPHPGDRGYLAVCAPMRCCGAKQPHASWQGPWHPDKESAQRDADEHNRRFADHGARVVSLGN